MEIWNFLHGNKSELEFLNAKLYKLLYDFNVENLDDNGIFTLHNLSKT